jgi:hypothetical protein
MTSDFAIGQNEVTNSNIYNYLKFDLLSSEIVNLSFMMSNDSEYKRLVGSASDSNVLKDFTLLENKKKIGFEDLIKDHKYYKKPTNLFFQSSRLSNKQLNRVEFHNSFWKSNMKMQYNDKHSSIGSWNFKVGPTL